MATIEDLEQRVDKLEKRTKWILEFLVRVADEFVFCSGSKQVPDLCDDVRKAVNELKN